MNGASRLSESRHGRTRRAAAVLALIALAGCQKFEARVEFRKGNAYYRNESYREALAQFQKGLALDPAATFAWRSVGLSALAMYRPGVETSENQRHAETAIDAFERYLAAHPLDTKAEEYLVTALIQAGRHSDALERLERRAVANPGDREVRRAIVTTLIQAGELQEALSRARRSGPRPDPQTLYSIAVAAWSRAYNDALLGPSARGKVVDLGLDAMRQALAIDPDYFEAMAYYNLLFREKAKLAAGAEEAQKYYALAEEWKDKALAARERQQARERTAGAGK